MLNLKNQLTHTNPSGDTINYHDASHSYLTEDLSPLKSVTRIVSNSFPKFDSEKISKRYAEKHNLSQTDVLQKWADKAKRGREWGDKMHFYAECLLKDHICPPPENNKEKAYYSGLEDFVKKLKKRYTIIWVEKVLFSIKYGIAGTLDVLLQDKYNQNRYVLGDWKSNEQIRKTNQFQNGLGELEHLDDCNFNHYSLQLNLYEWLIRKENYLVGFNGEDVIIDKKIIHITLPDPISMNCPDMQDEINYVLKNL